MTNEQLAALLQHIARQIYRHTSALEMNGCGYKELGIEPLNPQLEVAAIELRGLADMMVAQVKSLGGRP